MLLPVFARGLDRHFVPPALLEAQSSTDTRPMRWRAVPLGLIAVIVAVNAGLATTYMRRGPVVTLSDTPPLTIIHSGLVYEMNVTLTNQGNAVMTPRFAVQPELSTQALPWHIISGPEQLPPGTVGDYVITAGEATNKAFHVGRGAQVSYTLHDERPALLVALGTNPFAAARPEVRIRQTVSFPDQFSIWVYPTVTTPDPADEIYGLEFDDGAHRLWVLFGAAEMSGEIDGPDHRFVYVRALLNKWSRQTVNLRALYRQFGWAQPLATPRYKRDVRYAVTQVQLSMIVASASRQTTTWWFGPLEQAVGSYTAEALVTEALDHPDQYYITLGDQHRHSHNYHLAIEAYEQALVYNPDNAAAYFGLGEARFWLSEWEKAVEAFRTALDLGYPIQGLAYKGIGWSIFNQGDFAAAQSAFLIAANLLALRTDPDADLWAADAHNGVGWTWIELGNCTRAVAAFEEARALDYGLPGAVAGLRECARREASGMP